MHFKFVKESAAGFMNKLADFIRYVRYFNQKGCRCANNYCSSS